MKRALNVLLPAALLALYSCGSDDERAEPRRPAPENEGVYGFANGCYAVEGYSGDGAARLLVASGEGERFSFSSKSLDGAARFHLRASDLGTYLLYDTERHYLTATEVEGSYRLTRTDTLQSSVQLLDDSFRSPAEWIVEPSSRDAERFQLKHYQTGFYLTTSGLTENESEAAIVAMFPREGCSEYPEASIDAEGSVEPRQWPDGDAWGIAEVHSHIMTNFGFGGGGIFHGAPFHRLGVEYALPSCEEWHGFEGRRDLVGLFNDGGGELDIDEILPVLLSGEALEFVHHTDGWPTFTGWPNSWKLSTHQTMYYRWIERAYLAGLRLVVQHATGNSVLCDLVTGATKQGVRYSCNDMVSVERSIAETRNLERYIDAQHGGPGKGWLRIVETPEQARQVIGEGKLAVVLGIEISNLFDCYSTPKQGFPECTPDSVRAELDRYHDLGVRVVFPVHKYDNAFSAGDGSGGVIELGNVINSGHYSSFVEPCPDGPTTTFDGGDVTFGGLNKPRAEYDAPPPLDFTGFEDNVVQTLLPFADQVREPPLEGDYCQSHGLTALGETLIADLMKRGMMIDVAHLPTRALIRAYELLEAADYPALKTHGSSNGGRIYRLGGMVGERFGRCADPNEPGALVRGYTQAVELAAQNGAYPAEALSFDLNGFAGGPRPRFGDDSPCGDGQPNPTEYPITSYDGNVSFSEPYLGDRRVDYDKEGMIHIGLLPEYIDEVRRDGASDEDLEPLFRSAEAYIRMWERSELRAAAMNE